MALPGGVFEQQTAGEVSISCVREGLEPGVFAARADWWLFIAG